MSRDKKDIVAVDIIRLRAKLAKAEEANKRGDNAAVLDALCEVAGLTMSLATLVNGEKVETNDD